MKTLVIQTAWLGDNILTTPLVETLSVKLGEKIDILTSPKWRDVWKNNPYINEIVLFDKHDKDRSITGLGRLVKKIARNRYDVALLAQKHWRSAILAYMAKIPERIGFENSPAKILYTKLVPFRKKDHELARILALAEPLNIKTNPVVPRLFPSDDDKLRADKLLKDGGWRNEKIVVIAPQSAWETKRYPYFGELAESIVKRGYFLAVVGAGKITQSDRILNNTNGIYIWNEPILISASVMTKASVVIANDSGSGHMASAVGTPTITIFGPTVPAQGFAPWGEKNRVVQVALNCRPCSPHGPRKCPLGHHNCMKLIPPDEILKSVEEMLE